MSGFLVNIINPVSPVSVVIYCFIFNPSSPSLQIIDSTESIKRNFATEIAYAYTKAGVTTNKYTNFDAKWVETMLRVRQNETKSKDFIRCVNCGFDSRYPDKNHEKLGKITSGDELAAYNIAKRGLELITKTANSQDS